MSQPVLVLLTNHFPFGKGEAFIEPEISVLEKKFSRILIVSVSAEKVATRKNSHPVQILPIRAGLKDYLSAFRFLFFVTPQIIDLIEKENFSTGKNSRWPQLNRIFIHDLFKALSYATRIRKILIPYKKEKKILYSYWLNNRALAALLTAKVIGNSTVISRVHGGDLYTERHRGNYLPFRSFMATHLQALCFISDQGRHYFNKKYQPVNRNNQFVSRLGTSDFGLNPAPSTNEEVTLVSCSFLEPIKRIDFMIRAISSITKMRVHWIHLGGGAMEISIQNMAADLLSIASGKRFTLKGTLTPEEIRNFYLQHPVHVFINTSSSEGIPVTMMEAASAGIPLIGPAVGGIPEIISSENGILLPEEANEKDFAAAIQGLIRNPNYKSIRASARLVWERKFNAEVNFSNFADILLKLQNETGSGDSRIPQRGKIFQ